MSTPAISLAARSTYVPSGEAPGFKIGKVGIDWIGETLQQEGSADSAETVPQCVAEACWCAAQHECAWDARG